MEHIPLAVRDVQSLLDITGGFPLIKNVKTVEAHMKHTNEIHSSQVDIQSVRIKLPNKIVTRQLSGSYGSECTIVE